MQVFSFEIKSELNANPTQVWQDIFNMKAVNRELSPYARMTYPKDIDWSKSLETKQVLFSSWILLFGFIPVDQHFLRFEEINPGQGFHEYSYSIMHHFWRHKRNLEEKEGKTILKDVVEFAPQAALLGPILRELYKLVFRKRHQYLRKKYS
ncbi:MAG: hypothetical protein IPJ74_03810 [Saprospiraceae bacterium]|nr:hypothetical protein [Saprospiraceae bacterium]